MREARPSSYVLSADVTGCTAGCTHFRIPWKCCQIDALQFPIILRCRPLPKRERAASCGEIPVCSLFRKRLNATADTAQCRRGLLQEPTTAVAHALHARRTQVQSVSASQRGLAAGLKRATRHPDTPQGRALGRAGLPHARRPVPYGPAPSHVGAPASELLGRHSLRAGGTQDTGPTVRQV